METNIAGAYCVAILQDVKVQDETVVVLVTLRGVGHMLDECGDSILQFGNGVLEPRNLGSMLQGAGLDGEGKAVDELVQLSGGNVGVSVEGRENGTGGQWGDVSDGGPSRRRWGRVGQLGRHVDRVGGHEGSFD